MLSMTPRHRVLVVEAQLKHYRKALLEKLRTRLADKGIALRVAYSDPSPKERVKADTVELDEEIGVKVPIWWLLDDRISVQNVLPLIAQNDLIIIEQGNRHLVNYLLLALGRLGIRRVAYWGHGYNRQAQQPNLSEWLKRSLVTTVHWWFAYTPGVGRYLESQGVDAQRITILNNTIETEPLETYVAAVQPRRRDTRRKLLGTEDAHVGLFCGSLYPDKKLDFLIDSACLIRLQIPDFVLIIVGDGPERARIEEAAGLYPFIKFVGPRFAEDRAEYFAISDVFLMPGLVGLAVVDAFAAGLPVVTTTIPIHSPEIEYLVQNENSIVTSHDRVDYARAVATLLKDREQWRRLHDGARRTADSLRLDNMLDSFAEGIERALRV